MFPQKVPPQKVIETFLVSVMWKLHVYSVCYKNLKCDAYKG